MCGITGFIHKRYLSNTDLVTMNNSMSYRGPNDEGHYLDNLPDDYQIGFAHKRLSILDLSPLGHQPMFSDDKSIVIVFNGEIYNFDEIKYELKKTGYAFKSRTDTEVIIKAYQKWGIDCINKFNGMFSFALFDKKKNALYLARDRIGIKPLYYYYKDQEIIFASELKPIMKYPFFSKEINYKALNLYLFHGYITAPFSIFKDVYKLEPGKYLKFKNGEIEIKEYWSIAEKFSNRKVEIKSEVEYIEELDTLLTKSVNYRMISDVPLGAFLSGGIDSSTVVSIMQKISNKPINTFTIGFKEKGFLNEADSAKDIASYLGTNHHELYLPVTKAKSIIEDIPKYYDEPFSDSSQIPTMLVSKFAREHVTVSLSGDGGDELFCGYKLYKEIKKIKKFTYLSKMLKSTNKIFPLENMFGKIDQKLLKLFYLTNDESIINHSYLQSNYYLAALNKHEEFTVCSKYFNLFNLSDNIYEKYMLHDIDTYLPDDILSKFDRASMAVSLEARVPILDHTIVEFSFNLPFHMKCQNNIQKYILKKVLSKYIPKELYERPKRGFGIPISEWLHTDLNYLIHEHLSYDFLKKQDVFTTQGINRLLKFFKKKNKSVDRLIWNLIVFQMWWKLYIEKS